MFIFILFYFGLRLDFVCFCYEIWGVLLQIFDGHNGVSAALFAKEYLLDHVMSAVPSGIGRDEWLQVLPKALVAGFVKTDIEFQRKGKSAF